MDCKECGAKMERDKGQDWLYCVGVVEYYAYLCHKCGHFEFVHRTDLKRRIK
jgi:hypothetical protein